MVNEKSHVPGFDVCPRIFKEKMLRLLDSIVRPDMKRVDCHAYAPDFDNHRLAACLENASME